MKLFSCDLVFHESGVLFCCFESSLLFYRIFQHYKMYEFIFSASPAEEIIGTDVRYRNHPSKTTVLCFIFNTVLPCIAAGC